jgi:hypothetical protein
MTPSPNPCHACHVFTPQWVSSMVRRYGSRPDHSRPPLYWLWTAEERRERRELIECLVDLLPAGKRVSMVSRLRSPTSFRQAINELLVGDSLRKPEYELEFEPEIENLTPDWRVRAGSGDIIVEVVSSFRSEEDERRDNGWDRLRLRLQSIMANAFLALHPDFDAISWTEGNPPDERAQKRIVRVIREWLETEPAAESRIRIEGAEIQFWGRSDKIHHVSCSRGGIGFQVDTTALRDSIGAKASKYKGPAGRNCVPFVVSVVVDFQTGRELEDLEDAVFGTRQCRIVRSTLGETAQHYRAADGLFKEYPILSAVTFCEVYNSRIQHRLCINPTARHPLPEAAVELFQQTGPLQQSESKSHGRLESETTNGSDG